MKILHNNVWYVNSVLIANGKAYTFVNMSVYDKLPKCEAWTLDYICQSTETGNGAYWKKITKLSFFCFLDFLFVCLFRQRVSFSPSWLWTPSHPVSLLSKWWDYTITASFQYCLYIFYILCFITTPMLKWFYKTFKLVYKERNHKQTWREFICTLVTLIHIQI